MSDTELLLELKDGVLSPGYREGTDRSDSEAIARIGDETARQIYEYFQAFVDERRSSPPRQDVMGQMLGAEVWHDIFTSFRLGCIMLRLFANMAAGGLIPRDIAARQARESGPAATLEAQLAALS